MSDTVLRGPEPQKKPSRPVVCCGDLKKLDAADHPWEFVTDNGPGDVWRCPDCGAVSVD